MLLGSLIIKSVRWNAVSCVDIEYIYIRVIETKILVMHIKSKHVLIPKIPLITSDVICRDEWLNVAMSRVKYQNPIHALADENNLTTIKSWSILHYWKHTVSEVEYES